MAKNQTRYVFNRQAAQQMARQCSTPGTKPITAKEARAATNPKAIHRSPLFKKVSTKKK